MDNSDRKLIQKYRNNYQIPMDVLLTREMVTKHWELEQKLTQQLLRSTQESRWVIFEKCYTRLYSELWWLNTVTVEQGNSNYDNSKYLYWKLAIGEPPQFIYEIGSGKGSLIKYLAEQGFYCKGTEITPERGAKHQKIDNSMLEWGVSDGVHLDNFESIGSYDVVLSNQVLEHLHPDDLTEHFASAYKILKSQGAYIFATPHRFTGPHDVSKVFGCDNPKGMHLKEYTYSELIYILQAVGFSHFSFAFLRKPLCSISRTRRYAQPLLTFLSLNDIYLKLLLLIEKILYFVKHRKTQRFLAKVLQRIGLFTNNIFLVARKSQSRN